MSNRVWWVTWVFEDLCRMSGFANGCALNRKGLNIPRGLAEISRPTSGIEDSYRVEVVPPPGHFAVLDRDDGDEAVVVRTAGLCRFAVDLILEDHDRCIGISIDTEIVGAPHGHITVVVAVQVDDALSPFNPPGIVRHGNDVFE